VTDAVCFLFKIFNYFLEGNFTMANYGILRSSTNTGNESELIAVFTAPLEITSKKPSMINETITLKRKSSYSDTQRWEITAGLAPLADSSEMLVHSVINGYTEKFFVRMPQVYRKIQLSNNYNVSVFADTAGGEDYVTVAGLVNNILPVGEFIKFAGHGKVYMVRESTRLAANANRLKLFPKLINEVASGEIVNYGNKVTMAAMYGEENKIGVSYIDGILAQYDSLSLIEAL
jgi:hypothetical protein